jgi:hypothetical protein
MLSPTQHDTRSSSPPNDHPPDPLFTGKDNTSFDLGRVLWAFLTVAMVGQEAVAVYRGQPFDPITFSTDSAAMLAGGAGALSLKRSTEPGT